MALSFRRSHEAPRSVTVPAAVDSHTLRELDRERSRQQTGALLVEDHRTGARARIFLFQGHPYSVVIDGFTPDIAARLVSGGLLTPDQRTEVGTGAHAGQLAVARGWISAEQLGAVHQELMLAAFGAVAGLPRPGVAFEEGEVTDLCCTVPVAVDPLVESVPLRATRMSGTWSTLAASGDASSTSFVATGQSLPAALDRPEFHALLTALDPDTSLDAAAARAGFTRAEAVHLTGMLAAAHVVTVSATGIPAPQGSLLVPEEFGSRPGVSADAEAHQGTPQTVPSGGDAADPAAQRAELHALQAELAAAIEAEREAGERVSHLRERVHRLTALVDADGSS